MGNKVENIASISVKEVKEIVNNDKIGKEPSKSRKVKLNRNNKITQNKEVEPNTSVSNSFEGFEKSDLKIIQSSNNERRGNEKNLEKSKLEKSGNSLLNAMNDKEATEKGIKSVKDLE